MNPDVFILDQHGRPSWSFGGPGAWKTTTYRGYDIFLEWLIEPKETQPVLIIQPVRKDAEHGAFAICLGAVGLYLDESGDLAPTAKDLCRRALASLGKANIEIEVRTLMAVVHRWLPELIKMPPAPPALRREESPQALIEVELRDESSGKVQEEVSL